MTLTDKLEALAFNAWWSWRPEVLSLFERLNPETFRHSRNNPLAALRSADERMLQDERFAMDVDTAYDALQEYMHRPSAFEEPPHVAYFCMEYGLHESLPLYSGGLGILAGDHAKAASDLGLPFTAVGLLLREGYFYQHFSKDGIQLADNPPLAPEKHPLTRIQDADGAPVVVHVLVGDVDVALQTWKLQLGRTSLFLLDANFEANPVEFRRLTSRLYQGGVKNRIRQELLLGIGGLKLLRALSISPDIYHMNEGHCAFLTLELLREHIEAGQTIKEAENSTLKQCVFTTHTPVLAGHDRFSRELFAAETEGLRRKIGLSRDELFEYGRADVAHHSTNHVAANNAHGDFFMTVLALRLCRAANGVSKINGKIARSQWHFLHAQNEEGSKWAAEIGSITNGIHLPTWTAPHARAFLNERFGNWLNAREEPSYWEQVDDLTDEELWRYRCTLRGMLHVYAQAHTAQQSLPQHPELDPDALTIGFARRFATYKRALLLFQDEERARRLFASAERPVQLLYAGKAHPADEGGKALIKRIYELSQKDDFRGRLIFLENYNMEVGRQLVSGCDVWLNNPRPPMEASGTSGQKIAVHGGLNVSILDGWWPEGYDGENGWAIGDGTQAATPEEQDKADARALYEVLEREVIPCFYDRGEDGIPHRWVARMREAIRTLPAQFSASRMVRDYVEQLYDPMKVEI